MADLIACGAGFDRPRTVSRFIHLDAPERLRTSDLRFRSGVTSAESGNLARDPVLMPADPYYSPTSIVGDADAQDGRECGACRSVAQPSEFRHIRHSGGESGPTENCSVTWKP